MSRQFTTSVVGSFPRAQILKDAFKNYDNHIIDRDSLEKYIQEHVSSTVFMEEHLGLDIITDGEQGRTSFVNFIGDKIDGITPTHITKLNPDAINILKEYNTFIPYIRAVPDSYIDDDYNLTGDELDRIKTKKPIKITLPSPYLLMWETWHNTITKPFYKEPEDLGDIYVKIIRNEIKRLKARGVHTIQIDEPMLGNLLEANGKPDRYRKIFEIINGQKYRGFTEELSLAKDMLNKTFKGMSGIEMHICHWPNKNSPNYGTGVERLVPDIFDIKVSGLVIEYATPGSGDPVDLISQYPEELGLSLGVIDVRDHTIERPKQIVKQVETIIKYISPDKLSLVPDCGFSPGLLHPFPRNIAFEKIKSMVTASHILRKKYG